MIRQQITKLADFPPSTEPRLLVSVDTEEQWQSTPSREGVRVAPAGSLSPFQAIMDRHGITPLYFVDFPVVQDGVFSEALGRIHEEDRCEIGTHTHTHLTPPLTEKVTVANTFMGNLPRDLEHAKLVTMTESIERRFGFRPTIYRAGRYGVGVNTPAILEELGYEIDASVVPHTDFSSDGGPDFRGLPDRPYWFGGKRRLLEIPLTVGFAGLLRRTGAPAYTIMNTPAARHLRVPGIFNRLKLLTRIRLTPEAVPLDELKWLTKTLIGDGHRIFAMSLHSCSLEVGGSPYVRSEEQLQRFLSTIDRFCQFFRREIGGHASTYDEVARLCRERAKDGPETPKGS